VRPQARILSSHRIIPTPAPAAQVSSFWKWWPYALFQPILTIALFFPDANPFLDAACLGAVVLFARARPSGRAWTVWVALAMGIGLASRSTGTVAVLRAAGFAAILVLGFLASRAEAPRETRHRSLEAVGLCLAIPVIVFVLALLRDLHPLTYDPLLARIDAAGPPVAWRLAKAIEVNGGFRWACHLAYIGLPVAVVLVGELERAGMPRRRSVFASAALAALVGVFAYQIVPATGPKYAFAGYPGDQPPTAAVNLAEPVWMSAPRNAMPSLHVTWAMLVAWHAARFGWLAGSLGALFLSLTVLAALATGEHYLIDLPLALPFAVAVGAALAGRHRLAAACFLLVASGLVAVAGWGWVATSAAQ
jgi:hypothetical protein